MVIKLKVMVIFEEKKFLTIKFADWRVLISK